MNAAPDNGVGERSGTEARPSVSARPVVLALGAAAAAYVVANVVESTLIRLLRPTRSELEWISDIVLATGLGVVTFLWLHLKAARLHVTRLERARVVLDTQLAVAADIQRNLLPAVPPPRRGWRLAARLEPADRIGGDFFDFHEDGSGSILVFLADVSGKGIPAALILESTRTLFRFLARETRRPDQLLARLSRALYEENGGTPYVTCLLAYFDLEEKSLTCVNAGHPVGVVVGPGGRRLFAASGPPAGLFASTVYTAETVALRPGDAGVFVTDGISEAVEGDGALPNLLEAALRRQASGGPERVCEEVMRMARRGRGPEGAGEWRDDRTVIAFSLGKP